MPIDDLMAWLPAIDHLQSSEALQSVSLGAISAGNSQAEDTENIVGQLQSMIITPIKKRVLRKIGESPF